MIWTQNANQINVYNHYTQATDTQNIKVVFEVVKNDVLLRNIQEVIPGFKNAAN